MELCNLPKNEQIALVLFRQLTDAEQSAYLEQLKREIEQEGDDTL